jgi:glutamine amidotransferase
VIAILDYQAGNATSVRRALGHLGAEATITADPAVVAQAERVVFPGVGAAGSCMANLRSAGLDRAIAGAAASGKPVLVVCVGMQLLFDWSDEDGGTPCLGLLPGKVVRFAPGAASVKVPHMGWTEVDFPPGAAGAPDPLARALPDRHFYFVHSYHCVPGPGVEVIAQADHGGRFCAGVRRGNVAAVQFHPEKSGPAGLALLRNFLGG